MHIIAPTGMILGTYVPVGETEAHRQEVLRTVSARAASEPAAPKPQAGTFGSKSALLVGSFVNLTQARVT